MSSNSDSSASETSIADRLGSIQDRVEKAAADAGRDPKEIRIIAVSKRHSIDAIKSAYEAGQRDFGENYAQEFRDKAQALNNLDIRWHFIGQLQSNKLRYVAGRCLIHTIDRRSLLDALAKRTLSDETNKGIQDFLIEVKLDSSETQKGGVLPENVPALLEYTKQYSQLRCRGLMAIPPPGNDEDNHLAFRRLRQLRDELRRSTQLGDAHKELTELSMGMSADFETAVAEGSTFVRVGSAIFGPRPQ